MSAILFRKSALAAAILSLGVSLAHAQAAGSSAASPAPSGGAATAPATSPAPSAARDAGTAKNAVARGDAKFMQTAAAHGLAEVELGNLAKQKAASDQVKQFADRMVQDHTKANDELKSLAGTKGVQLPAEADRKHRREMDKLQKLSGDKFDREYMKSMVSDHRKDVREFEKAAKSSKDAELKSFASSALPTLQEHLKLAQSTNHAVRQATRGSAATAVRDAASSARDTTARAAGAVKDAAKDATQK